jgi:hypothetical protein
LFYGTGLFEQNDNEKMFEIMAVRQQNGNARQKDMIPLVK